ncbi:hypothetical protein FLJC2902T_01950 [Flavobacterium limnosediminis JC2902]|uniref:Lipoprotein n=1 Tax=Flavobacterium limnosediminis JC2902 TaxID=1341181 RepID=V6SSW3_9FLAO|nr:hypothetical protein [Flavobacterium limnosediminis]ESU29721.1 hypothetical protein FLJC2902T_01950 [Flavobacterium limnosediminis JC2902]
MKKSFLKLFGLLAMSAAVLTSCSKEDDEPTPPSSSFVADATNFQGTINDGTVTLNSTLVYKLTGKIQVNSGATLIIPAGTKIEGMNGTSSYIAVAQGGKINVLGTASSPVVFTSGKTNKAPGDWGGLVICGKAPINIGSTTAQSEVADLTYGGTISNDNSGVLQYLRIEYAGAAFNATKEFNGISFFGVGSGTVVENVEAYHGADDGFEFFGGTVNTTKLVSIGNEDDQFDWTEGWNGTNSNWYGKLDFGKGNRGIEADNYEFNFDASPTSNPTISNITLIGPGSTADANIYTENQAFKLRRGTKGIFSNIFIKDFKVGFDVEHDQTIAYVANQTLKATAAKFDGIATNTKGKKTDASSSDVSGIATLSDTATGAGNGAAAPSWTAQWTVGF